MTLGAKGVSIIIVSAALYAIFFFPSGLIAMPNFTFLYLPIILLGVFPIWFGWNGLVGSMIGAYIGGIFVESLPLHIAWVEVTTTLIIYGLNWLLIPQKATEARTKMSLVLLSVIYAVTLFVGTCAILFQFTLVGLFTAEVAQAFLLPTFALNLPIVLITCPPLIRAISPKLKSWGMHSGNFREWRNPVKA
jgi:hypothetical protein